MANEKRRDDDDDQDEDRDEDRDEDADDDEAEEEESDDDDDEDEEPSSRRSSASAKASKVEEPRSGGGMIWLAVAGVALLGAWWLFRNRGDESSAAKPERPSEAAQRPAPALPAPPEPAKLPERVLEPPAEPAAPPPQPSAEKKAVPEPTTSAAPAAPGSGFDKLAALKAISESSKNATRCRMRGEPAGTAQISVTFEASGKIKESHVMPGPFLGTATGKCILDKISGTTVSPFPGETATVIAPVQVH